MDKYNYLFDGVSECWQSILKVEFLVTILDAVSNNPQLSPPIKDVFGAFKHFKLEELKVIIIGQDPYINPGEAHGMSFSVSPGLKVPPSLKNIYKAIIKSYNLNEKDIINGDLTSWAKQGVLLLNAALTTVLGLSNVHADLWKVYTDHIINELVKKNIKFCVVLWGDFAKKKEELIPKNIPIFKFKHPSPLSTKGPKFEDCDNFIEINKWLRSINQQEIIWYLGTQQVDKKLVVIFTDGAASANGKADCSAGWGVYIPKAPFYTAKGELKESIGYEEEVKLSGKIFSVDKYSATNNRAEMGAIYAALTWVISKLPADTNILIISDSLYSINTLTEWYGNWIEKGIFEEKKNQDLIVATVELLKLLPHVKFLHMRGHGKDTFVCQHYIAANEIVDKLATGAVQNENL